MTKVFSVLVGLGMILSATAAIGQAPPDKEKKAQKPKMSELDAAIAASANHPDVRLAQAKLQMAQAELDQAKLQVAQRIAAAYARLKAAKEQVEIEERNYRQTAAITNAKFERTVAERALAQAKAALAAAEAEWQAARGQPAGQQAATLRDAAAAALSRDVLTDLAQQQSHATALAFLLATNRGNNPPAPGSAADKLRELVVVGKRVKLDLKEPVPFNKAMDEFFKQADLGDLTVRIPEWANERYLKTPPKVGPLIGEQTVAGWLQLILDDFNRSLATLDLSGSFSHYKGKYEVYVRDYGLLIAKTDLAPPGALTLADFARQVRAEKDAAQKPEPKE